VNADIWNVDLMDTPKETIQALHEKGRRVTCYLSAGGSESWRSDFNQILPSDMGDVMPKWQGERWLNIRSPTVWSFVQKRVRLAYEKGCDAIDPDNVDAFNDDFDRGGGFTPKLTEADSVEFVRKLADEIHRYGMAMGLKNAETLLPNVTDSIQFAVNEECTTYEEGCKQYTNFIQTGKPVFHLEYVKVTGSRGGRPQLQSIYPKWANLSTPDIISYYCLRQDFGNAELISADLGAKFSTSIKLLDLGGWVMYCDGSWGDTPTQQTYGGPEREEGGRSGRGQRGNERAESPAPASTSSLGGLFQPVWDMLGLGSKTAT